MTTRIKLGNGKWFDLDTSEQFNEATRFDGNNHVSVATGSQWSHERLFRTRKGLWVLFCWSQWQGSKDSYAEVSDDEAYVWLLANNHDKEVPAEIIAKLEI